MLSCALKSEIAHYRRQTLDFRELDRLVRHAGQLVWLLRCKPGGAAPDEWESLWRYLRDEVDPAARRLAMRVARGGDLKLPRTRYVQAGPAEEESTKYLESLRLLLEVLPWTGLTHSE